MENFFKKTKTFFVLSTLLVLGIFVGFGELIYLKNYGKELVLGVQSDNSINLMIGSDSSGGKEIDVTQNISSDDARPLIIRKYLEKYNHH